MRWLGIYFDNNLTFKNHVEIRLQSAEKTLNQIARLSNTERGLSFQAIRQLYIACIASIADYGVPIWWKDQKNLLNKYRIFQNKALRRILGAFKTSPTYAMEIEAFIPPIRVRFDKICRIYALRIISLQSDHPIRARVSKSFPLERDLGIDLDWNKFYEWSDLDYLEEKKAKKEVS